MAPIRAIGCLAVVAAVAARCSSSTSLSDPFTGNWNVTFTSAPTGTAVTPSPWVLAIAKNGSIYTVTYARLTWASTNSGTSSALDEWTETNSSTFAILNDSLHLLADDAIKGCFLSFQGAFISNTASGTASNLGTSCASGSFTWSAKKQ